MKAASLPPRDRARMNIHEHQAKAVLSQYGVPVPRGFAAFTVDEAVEAANKLGGPVWVVNAQIHAGGAGKWGGGKAGQATYSVAGRGTRLPGVNPATKQK